jgi:hypothetical protein
MTEQGHLISAAYTVMAATIAVFLATTLALWALGA